MGCMLCFHQNLCASATPQSSLKAGIPRSVISTGNGRTRDCIGEEQSLRGLHQSRSWLLHLHPGQDTWGQEKSLKSVNCRHYLAWKHVWHWGHSLWGAVTRHMRGLNSHLFWTTPLSPMETSVLWVKRDWASTVIEGNLHSSSNNNLHVGSHILIHHQGDLLFLCPIRYLIWKWRGFTFLIWDSWF
jgi:hypothetical protein